MLLIDVLTVLVNEFAVCQFHSGESEAEVVKFAGGFEDLLWVLTQCFVSPY
jgi:hypothetical protein